MKLRRIPNVRTKTNGYSEWITPHPRNYIFVCCDCGLAHRMQFRLVQLNPRFKDVQFRVQRAEAYTRRERRK